MFEPGTITDGGLITAGLSDFSTVHDLRILLGRRPLAFGDLEQIQALRWIELAESLIGADIECAKCEGVGACLHCDAECATCDGSGDTSIDRQKLDDLTIHQVRKLSLQARAA